MKYQTYNKRFEPIQVRKSRGSLTVPDMSFTPREIIAKFSRGEKVPLGFLGKYDAEESEDDPTFRGYDPAIFEDDPTRDPNFDFGDYVEERHALKQREAERKKEETRQKASAAKQKAKQEKESVSEKPTATPKSEADATSTGE